jgi:hypothetical protein
MRCVDSRCSCGKKVEEECTLICRLERARGVQRNRTAEEPRIACGPRKCFGRRYVLSRFVQYSMKELSPWAGSAVGNPQAQSS